MLYGVFLPLAHTAMKKLNEANLYLKSEVDKDSFQRGTLVVVIGG